MRISYYAIAQGPYTIAARQVDEMTLIGAGTSAELVIKPGQLSPDELFAEVGEEASSTYRGLLYVGGLVLFLGVFSLLRTVAPGLDLRPKVAARGATAALVVSAGVSLVTMLLFLVLGATGL
jgi:hypothetical protein